MEARMSPKTKADWDMAILAPTAPSGGEGDAPIASDGSVTLHSLPFVGTIFHGKVEEVPAASVQGQWAATIGGLLESASDWVAHETGPWQIEEVTVGLTLSAKGKLLFIAEASAEGSIQLKLTRKPASKKLATRI
jgi:hypothetical protein